MEFTGRAPFEWVDVPRHSRKEGGLQFNLQCAGITLGMVWKSILFPEPGAEWLHDYGYAPTLEEAQSALLAALGIVVEWETPKAEEGEET